MITESSPLAVKSAIARFLATFAADRRDRDEIMLDIIEFIAVRMPSPSDNLVYVLGLYVRGNLAAFLMGAVSYGEIHARLSEAALAAGLHPSKFLQIVYLGSGGQNDPDRGRWTAG